MKQRRYLDVRIVDERPTSAERALAEIAGMTGIRVRELGEIALSSRAVNLLNRINAVARAGLGEGV